MINWNLNYSFAAAEEDFKKLEVKAEGITPININDEWMKLRNKLIEARDKVFDEHNYDEASNLAYDFDIHYGVELYSILNAEDGFEMRQACDDNIWRYLSIRVIPDIVHSRFGLKEEHFFKKPNRVWLKSIWWYIYLAWSGNKEETLELIKKNSTDTIMNMAERPGLGYYTDVYHEILVQYKEINEKLGNRDVFREVLKLNTVRLMTVSPELIEGGIPAYVKSLFDAVEGSRIK